MQQGPQGLNRSVDSVVHELASTKLEQARSALLRAELESDEGGLREFRTATRSLRGLLQAYSSSADSAD
jgi:hypothetical protein